MRGKIGVVALSLALSCAGPALANNVNKTMAAGGQIRLFGYYLLNPDCSSMGDPVLRVTSQPAHGTVKMAKGSTYPNTAAGTAYAACSSVKVASVNVDYRAEAGFTGSDTVTIEAIYPNGVDRADTYYITVK